MNDFRLTISRFSNKKVHFSPKVFGLSSDKYYMRVKAVRSKQYRIKAIYKNWVEMRTIECRSMAEAWTVVAVLFPNADSRTVHPMQDVVEGVYYGSYR